MKYLSVRLGNVMVKLKLSLICSAAIVGVLVDFRDNFSRKNFD